MAVPSPCVNVCTMDERRGLCRGCLRTLDEIARWSSMSEQDKLQVWRLIRLRQQAGGTAGDAPGAGRTPPGAA
ncbi:MAG: DUF1289 domain-containing protein [Thiomonas sp.]